MNENLRIVFYKSDGGAIVFFRKYNPSQPRDERDSLEASDAQAAKKIVFFKPDGGIVEFEKYNPRHDPKNGRFTSGGGGGDERSSQKETSSQQEHSAKAIGQNKEPLLAEHMPTIRDLDGFERMALPGSEVTKIHSFAGKGTKTPVRVEPQLIERFGGKEGQGQHTTGDVKILKNDSVETAEVHWFQEPSVGIVSARVKRWREKKE